MSCCFEVKETVDGQVLGGGEKQWRKGIWQWLSERKADFWKREWDPLSQETKPEPNVFFRISYLVLSPSPFLSSPNLVFRLRTLLVLDAYEHFILRNSGAITVHSYLKHIVRLYMRQEIWLKGKLLRRIGMGTAVPAPKLYLIPFF